MQRLDRIEKRRFVGREFLLWLWFESELFDATLQTQQHGDFELWLEKRLVVSGTEGSTRVTAPRPGVGREAKEALLRDRLPESAGVHIGLADAEFSFALTADTLGVSALKWRPVLGEDGSSAGELQPDVSSELDAAAEPAFGDPANRDPADAALYERLRMIAVLDQLLETLYSEFLVLRLSDSWCELVVPLLRRWAEGRALDLEEYEAVRRPPLRTHSEVIELTPDEAEALVELVDDTEPFDDLAPQAAIGE